MSVSLICLASKLLFINAIIILNPGKKKKNVACDIYISKHICYYLEVCV